MAKFTIYCFDNRDWIRTATVTTNSLTKSLESGSASFEIYGNHGIIVDKFGIVVATWDKARSKPKVNAYYKHNYKS